MGKVQVVLFDLGGVLIRLRGVQALLTHLEGRMDEAGLMHRWLFSPAVRTFESGRCSLGTFCADIVRELDLPMDEAGFLRLFMTFLDEPFPEAAEILPALAKQMPTGILSNTSDAHWQMCRTMLPALDVVRHLFLSFRMGLLKPDAAMFRKVLSELDAPPGSVLYFDDHPANVIAARAEGIQAVQVSGFAEAVQAMASLGLLPWKRMEGQVPL
jgi:glucose-1-phosphatase